MIKFILRFCDVILIGFIITMKNTVYYPGNKSYLGFGAREHSLFLSVATHIYMTIAILHLITQYFSVDYSFQKYIDYCIATTYLITFYIIYIWNDRLSKTISKRIAKKHSLIYSILSVLYFGLALWLFIVI
jgi:hypothetical protein